MIESGMQFDAITEWYGNSFGLFDSIHSAGEGSGKFGREKTTVQMTIFPCGKIHSLIEY
jgi:hypothetical protein